MDSVLLGIVSQIDNDIKSLQAAKAAIIQTARNSNSNGTTLSPTLASLTKGKTSTEESEESTPTGRRKNRMSAAGRKRIAEASRRRWRELKKAQRAAGASKAANK